MSMIPQLMSGRALEHGVAMTVDHGGTASAKMYVGGQAKATVADGTSHENDGTEGSLEKLTIPANSLVAGSTLRVWASGFVEDSEGSHTLIAYIRLGTHATLPASNTAAFTSGTINTDDNDIYCMHGVIQIRTAGSSGTAVAMWSYQDPDAAGTAPKWQVTTSFAVDTTSVLYLDFSADWSATDAGDETNATMFVVDIVNPGT